ncbi:MAG: hypothetical protein OEQ25_16655 [Gammaproteobacteria bacterium]|nr:hypothetical protein [Gammaproteobacteria bacterium]MDH3508769.1 hypothetical protein [Gammaproteobacteria bacterium]
MRTFRARPVRVDQRLALIAIESVEWHRHRSSSSCRFSAFVEPIALVVCGPETVRALDMQGNSVDMDELRRNVPGLDAELGTYDRSAVNCST